MRGESILDRVDWVTISLYLAMVLLGWSSIYAAIFDEENAASLFSLAYNPGKQLVWIGTAMVMIIGVMSLDFKFYDYSAYFIYGAVILLLIAVLTTGTVVAGSKSWFQIGSFRLQPAEFAKFATALALAKYLGDVHVKFENPKTQLIALAILGGPMLLILLQGDAGSAMVFGSFLIVLFREGMSPIYFILGFAFVLLFILTLLVSKTVLFIATTVICVIMIGVSFKQPKRILATVVLGAMVFATVVSVDFLMTSVLKPHQRSRLISLVNPDADPLGAGWNVTQSKIAIGSGGFFGKGFLQGTQTKFDFVPEQSTDFIFCTIGEEQGWFGSLVLIALFVTLLIRISIIAERQKSKFARIYAYGVLSVFFFHFAVNIAMTIGFFPVIGIPLPFFSYGGSSLWSFTILLFILIKLDSHRMQILMR
ncbi:rod shape-determining protein RodA [Reichenbachiella carrageenanivorans]|uniref:Rod shape-determining protein RodA n=1 Tax=Reichenbachiella carrageenanivorans TaxID=2979869 RepID=A0ABY6D8K4_9BACT|nr:rod shape-determining protein RodA [Reichenbachiella carrageenanivorans]UXX80210.1 rod shape-determining protein RodA [Reichenbachiella carrageenanivorans]